MHITDDKENQSDFDTAAAVAEISADLFGQGGESEDGESEGSGAGAEGTPGGEKPVESSSSQQPEKTGQPAQSSEPLSPEGQADPSQDTSQQVQDLGAPKTWTKEALAEWAAVPPRVQQEVLKREEDFLRGITQYKERAEGFDRYNAVVAPYAPILAAENIDPVQMFQSFAANHYLLTRGTEDQKLQLAASMIQGYGIDFGKLVNFIGDQALEPVDPRIQQLEAKIAQLESTQSTRQQQETQAAVQRIEQEVEAFANDPAHPFFNEVVDDIAALFKSGQAATLQEAYEKAVYLNPTTRQKEIDRLTAERANSQSAAEEARKAKIAKASAADLSLDPKARNGTVPVGSIDDTLAETMARIQGRA